MNNNSKYIALREQFKSFHYHGFSVIERSGEIFVTYNFSIADNYHFSPTLTFHTDYNYTNSQDKHLIDNMFFHIGMVELISYWKIACPPKIIIHPKAINDKQILWWKHLMYQGLGEFFYINNIDVKYDDFVQIVSEGIHVSKKKSFDTGNGYLIPIGGGKDSVLTLEILKDCNAAPFAINPRKAQLDTLISAGFLEKDLIIVTRTLDPLMLSMNRDGFLNGHTPFSALLAFITLPVALFSQKRHIALSNESSANESTVLDSKINHQYSKSLEFEDNFREYVQEFITEDIRYFSMLRPLSELQITSLFAQYREHHSGFRSCNMGSKNNEWCGKCSKCMFTFIMLSAFLDQKEVQQIFGTNMFDDMELLKTVEELAGLWPSKPFECVGTAEEVIVAINHIIKQYDPNKLPVILKNIRINQPVQELSSFIKIFDTNNNLTNKEFALLQHRIDDINI